MFPFKLAISKWKFVSRNDIIIRNIQQEPNYTEALNYFDSIALYTDELRKLQRSLRVTIG